jgi:hypothetical protein
MGWLCHNDKLRHETPVQYVTREFSRDGRRHSTKVLDAAAVRGVIYAAIRNTDTESSRSHVFCGVFLFRNNAREGFGYKAMDEAMGPCEVDCPDRIMRLLSPVEDIPSPGYTADWRARVAAAKASRASAKAWLGKLSPGDTVCLPAAAHFAKAGFSADRFIVISIRKRTPIFVPAAHPWFRCRLHPTALATASVERSTTTAVAVD